ncbi:hypothetical protein CJD36_010765 [Flavipsychrobacter stenotrophus]|uniref:Carboxypeptidase-like regulatory domain-containing protein n=1 Tax=Flavipsychrobacter stenotrophus TaxID=2077091 RepID=A0A2S7SU50_9BACT|nr:hypothetical protein [Flavipsychrobacter stenotrophus]PQJ10449.1 hypothetical protein CJD36_010765 [Flavipsychrobacter stenotrophus]
MKTRLFLLSAIYVFLLGLPSFAQTTFKGLLINTRDSSAIPFAVITLEETNSTVLGDDIGNFIFTIPAELKQMTFKVSVVGYKTTLQHKRTFDSVERVYLEVGAYALKEAEIVGESAEGIVHKAVAAIPTNYESNSYFAFSSYRQYQQVNNTFVNLIEAQPIVMFKLTKEKKGIHSTEAFAERQTRRSLFFENPSNEARDNVADLMEENPVYHLATSSIANNKLYSYTFNFDTTYEPGDYYVINYLCKAYSSERHGVQDPVVTQAFRSEAYETGQLIIDRSSLAFVRVQRKAVRNPGYYYPHESQLNFIYPKKEYFFEFNNAELIAEYELIKDKWYLKTLRRQYTDDFYNAGWGNKIYVISDVFEWRCDSISRYTTADHLKEFYPRLRQYGAYKYDKAFWSHNDLPFYFHKADAVFNDLGKFGDVDKQFVKQGEVGK